MYFYIYNGVIYTLDHQLKIADFKTYLLANTFKKKNYFVDNIKISYDIQDKTYIPYEKDILNPYILYNISIVPIDCEKHLN